MIAPATRLTGGKKKGQGGTAAQNCNQAEKIRATGDWVVGLFEISFS
jgi:hypothetical protein